MGGVFAGGNVVLNQRLNALQSEDKDKIQGWGMNDFHLADLSLLLEDLVKLQPDSPLLKGIAGVVETSDGNCVAIDANYVYAAVKKGKYKPFKKQLSRLELVKYSANEEELYWVKVPNVILFPYDGTSIKLNPDQFNAVNAEPIKRKDIIHDRDMEEREIVKSGKVIHPAWKIYNPKMIVSLVRKTFEYNKKTYDHDTNMGFYLPNKPRNNAQGYALRVSTLYFPYWSRLFAWDDLGNNHCRPIRVLHGAFESDTQKSE
jgi:hypothetical protein